MGSVLARANVPFLAAAGPLRAEQLHEEGLALLRRSRREYGKALRMLSVGPPALRDMAGPTRPRPTGGTRTSLTAGWLDRDTPRLDPAAQAELETAARSALTNAVAAYNYLEDDPLGESAHQHAHAVAELVHDTVGCAIQYEDGKYWDVCPLSLMHHRWGFSIGMTSRRTCSICGEDIEDCPHLLGRSYPLIVMLDEHGRCNACGYTDCAHEPGKETLAYPRPVISDVKMHETSLVRRPRDPLARLTRVEYPADVLFRNLGRVPAGEALICHRCVGPCSGFMEFPEPGGRRRRHR